VKGCRCTERSACNTVLVIAVWKEVYNSRSLEVRRGAYLHTFSASVVLDTYVVWLSAP